MIIFRPVRHNFESVEANPQSILHNCSYPNYSGEVIEGVLQGGNNKPLSHLSSLVQVPSGPTQVAHAHVQLRNTVHVKLDKFK